MNYLQPIERFPSNPSPLLGTLNSMSSELEHKPRVTPPSVNPNGSVNPSSPTSGTEGYGMQPGEPGGDTAPGSASDPNARGAGDVRQTSYPLPEPEGERVMENKSRQDELRDNPNNRMGKRSLACRDAGQTSCNWSVVGENDDDVMRQAEQHARDEHGVKNFDDNTRQRVRDAIRDSAA